MSCSCRDVLVVRVRSDDGQEEWGECEAAPLISIVAWCCPMSNSACKPVGHTVLGARIDAMEEIRRLNREVRRNSFVLLCLTLLLHDPFRTARRYLTRLGRSRSPRMMSTSSMVVGVGCR